VYNYGSVQVAEPPWVKIGAALPVDVKSRVRIALPPKH
jgi:hypothetical protein